MLFGFSIVLIFFVVGLLLLVVALLLAKALRPAGKDAVDKYIPYECGETARRVRLDPFQHPLLRLRPDLHNIRRGNHLPSALGRGFRALGPFAFVEGLIFIAILAIGLAYVWKKGDLSWIKPAMSAR